MVWTRDWGYDESTAVREEAEARLAALDVDRMVVAHTVQYARISSMCGGTVWRIDVGLSDYYVPHGAPVTQVLEITNGVTTILK